MVIALRLPVCLLSAVLASAALTAQVDPGAAGGSAPPPAAGDPGKAAPADGADGKPGAPADGKPAAAAAAIPISKLVFDKSELPAGLTLGKDVCCISDSATKYFVNPGTDEKIPAPVNKSGQCFQ